jgi:hypothetical protein
MATGCATGKWRLYYDWHEDWVSAHGAVQHGCIASVCRCSPENSMQSNKLLLPRGISTLLAACCECISIKLVGGMQVRRSRWRTGRRTATRWCWAASAATPPSPPCASMVRQLVARLLAASGSTMIAAVLPPRSGLLSLAQRHKSVLWQVSDEYC